MRTQNYPDLLLQGTIVFALALLPILLWPQLLTNLLAMQGFMPHGHCYLWKPTLVWLHVLSDSFIGLSYVAISGTLAYLVYKARREIPFHSMFLAFGAFIVACGMTHFLEVWTLWYPTYWLSGGVKLITAIASVTTAIALPPLVPKALSLLQTARVSEERRLNLETANQQLQSLYAQLKQLDELKTQFFANVSHELRTPLTLILGPIHKLLSGNDLSPEQQHDLEVVQRNARVLLKQVNDLLDLSKLEAGKMKLHRVRVDLAQSIRQIAANFDTIATQRHIYFHVETPSSLSVWVDPHKVERVVLNLLSNAFKFTPEGGAIRCLLYLDSGRSDRSGESREGVAIAIEDSGPGVPDSLRESIFDRFSQIEGGATRRFGGTGLGLAIVKEFVELHGGTVTVADAPSGGALFTVELPLLDPLEDALPTVFSPDTEAIAATAIAELSYPDAAIEILAPENGDNSQPLLLIVEDNLEMNRFLCDTLRSEYRVATAFNGERGVDLAVSLRPDLIISDVMMPVLSGDRLVERLRTYPELNRTPIIMLTAKADDELRVRLLREGVQDYLMKPFSVEELQARSRNLISMKRVRDVLQQELQTHTQDLEVLAHELASSKRDLQSALTREQQQTEELTRANRVKDEFLSIVSHELRTPLNSILGWTQLLRSRQMNREKVDRALETIERNARQQVNLIDDILNVSRIVRGKVRLNPIPLQLERVVEAAIATVSPTAEAKQIQIGYTCAPTLSAISGDPDRLDQIVWNLLLNAVKFTSEGGRIDVAIAQSNSHVTLQVRDTGIGISPEFLPHIFEGFRQADSSTTRAFGGLGLGLTIVRCLVELHGGTVEGFSEGLDKGATFTVTFPAIAQSPEEYSPSPDLDSQEGFSNQLWSLDGLQVLLVDDDLDTGELMATVLTQYGVQVRVATSAAEAIASVKQFPPDILVSDIGMPGQDGYGLIRQLRQLETERGSQIPAIALTAFTREEDRAKALLAGFQLHVAKPVEPAKLARILAQFAAQISKIDG